MRRIEAAIEPALVGVDSGIGWAGSQTRQAWIRVPNREPDVRHSSTRDWTIEARRTSIGCKPLYRPPRAPLLVLAADGVERRGLRYLPHRSMRLVRPARGTADAERGTERGHR